MCTRWLSRSILACCCLAVQSSLPSAFAQDPALQKLADQLKKFKARVELDKSDPARPFYDVSFWDRKLQPAELAELRPILQETKLPISLNLNDPDYTDADIAALRNLKCLRGLSMQPNKVTNSGLEHLSGLINLEELYIDTKNITDAGLAHLSKLEKLRRLTVRNSTRFGTGLTAAGYAHLAGLTELEELNVGRGLIGDQHLSHMKGMTKLKELSIGGEALTDAGMAQVANFTALRRLRISDGKKVARTGLDGLANLKNLEQLSIFYCPALKGDGLTPLTSLPKLRELEIEVHRPGVIGNKKQPALDAQAGQLIGKIKNLEILRLKSSISPEVLEGFKGLASLKELELSAPNDAAIAPLSDLNSLRVLRLERATITNAGLRSLSGLTELEALKIEAESNPFILDKLKNNKKISDDGLAYLVRLKNLRELDLRGCSIQGPGLKHLSGMSKLEKLTLKDNPVTDEGLTHLQALIGLRNLNLRGTKVEEDAVLLLKKLLPSADIIGPLGEEVVIVKENPRKQEDLRKIAADFKLSARDYHKEFADDKEAALKKYKHKVVELAGDVYRLEFDREPYVTLDVRTEAQARTKRTYSGVDCYTAEAQPWSRHAAGQKIKIKGRQDDEARPKLLDCVVIEASANPAVVVSVADFARELAADLAATRAKYVGKTLLLSGVLETRENNSNGVRLVLKTEGRLKIHGSVMPHSASLTKSLKAGDPITLYGEMRSSFDDYYHLLPCLPIKNK